MDGASAAGGGGGGGGSGGPAPFLLKTYDMVDDSSTDKIVSWSSSKNSFVVWNPPELARLLLPLFFKHNNFSSFIRQLNTYGFRKIDPEKWEFANEDFMKDQKHLLKNIHRRKPIHSHSNPQSSLVDPEKAAFEEDIGKLLREKAELEAQVLKYKQQQSAAKVQLENFSQRVNNIKQRQESLLAFVDKAVQSHDFVVLLARKLESMDFSAYNKKRRVPQVDSSQPVPENSFVDTLSSSRPELGNIFHEDLSNTLRLELPPSVSDVNLVSHSTQSSNEDGESPQRRLSEGYPKDSQVKSSGLLFSPETLELSDTGTSFTFKMDPVLFGKAGGSESPRMQHLQQSFTSNEEGDGHISCHLNLTLASSTLQLDKSQYTSTMPQFGQETGKSSDSRANNNGKEVDFGVLEPNKMSSEDSAKNQGQPNPKVQVNDVFWEQFLTERPGSSETEEAGSNYRSLLNNDQEDRRPGMGMSRNAKSMGNLTL